MVFRTSNHRKNESMTTVKKSMGTFVAIFTCVIFIHSVESLEEKIDDRIIGGHSVMIEEAPYMVSMMIMGKNNCGGAIISQTYVLTAAHCINGDGDYELKVGTESLSLSGTVHTITRAVVHPDYGIPTARNNDIALVKVNPPFSYSNRVKPIKLPNPGGSVPSGTLATVSGWGYISLLPKKTSQFLQLTEVNTISNYECESVFPGEITPQMLCAGNKNAAHDACFGDSGGPLVANGIVIGVVSWGPEGTCASQSQPYGVYTNVTDVLPWIKKVAEI